MRIKRFIATLFLIVSCLAFLSSIAYANQAEIIEVKITPVGNNQYRIDTTIKHADTGWKHYANAWLVFDEAGNKLGERILHHPHVNEQPFTRSLRLTIAKRVKTITIKAQDSVHGLNDKGMQIKVPHN